MMIWLRQDRQEFLVVESMKQESKFIISCVTAQDVIYANLGGGGAFSCS